MKERSVRFTAHEVLATLAGTKTQMRRAVKGETSGAFWDHRGWTPSVDGNAIVWRAGDVAYEHRMPRPCPYGVPGDRLWVKETWAAFTQPSYEYGECDEIECAPRDMPELYGTTRSDVVYAADGVSLPQRWRSSIHMPRWASRITLAVTTVRVERLHDITEEDARAEGVMPSEPSPDDPTPRTALYSFRSLWCDAHGWDAWKANPWVWVVEFRRIAR